MTRTPFSITAFCIAIVAGTSLQAQLPQLKVSENRHFLTTADGKPFFYLGDTGWELFHRLDRADAEFYLKRRAEQGFNVIQAVALAEFDGLGKPNAYGHRPLIDNDPTRPDVKDGPDNDYWDHVDWIVEQANKYGLYIGFLPTWGDKWNKKWGQGPEVFTPANAETYGEWLGRRYRDRGIIWILGGDRPVENDTHRAIIEGMARGLKRGDGGVHLITYHPSGGKGSSDYFPDAPWIDFHMRQNGHNMQSEAYKNTRTDYNRTPPRPVIDGEPIYEGHPVSFKAEEFGHSIGADCRHAMYWDLFTGACGHTYGHHTMWQFYDSTREPKNNPLMPWREAIDDVGATQMVHGRRLIESRPFLTRVPADDLIVPAKPDSHIPGRHLRRFVATRDSEGSYAMIYAPIGRKFTVRTSVLPAKRLVAWWYDPRTGASTKFDEFDNAETREFLSPSPGEFLDWVLVLDDANGRLTRPGQAP